MSDWLYPDVVVETEWLEARLEDESVRVFECTTYLRYRDDDPNLPYIVESGRADYESGHIKGAAFLDLQGELSNADSPYPVSYTHLTLPTISDV